MSLTLVNWYRLFPSVALTTFLVCRPSSFTNDLLTCCIDSGYY
nr:MAG TPA: hypothetical protein [Caudoviricetes sp.]